MTPHDEAFIGDFAETRPVAGDRLREFWIAGRSAACGRMHRARGATGFTRI